jgi:thiamine biosynthesis lipoprotein
MTACVSGCGAAARLQRFECTRPAMGVECRVVVYHDDAAVAKRAMTAALDEINRWDSILSDYKPDSESNRLCAMAGRGPQPVSGDLFIAVAASVRFSQASAGAFDVTIGPLTQLWRGAFRTGEWPGDGAIEAARRRTNWRLVNLDSRTTSIELATADMRLDFGGIGQGIAADHALRVLREHGCRSALVDISGDVALGDSPPERDGWTIDVRFQNSDASESRLSLSNCAVTTSGSSGRSVEFAGRPGVRWSHIIDPREGLPLHNAGGVCVIARDATTADALATTFSVLGPDEARTLAAQFSGVRVIFEHPGLIGGNP